MGNRKSMSKMPYLSDANTIQVGGSLGGLATGIALKEIGHDITILERNSTPLLHDQGAGIVAGGDSLAFLKRYNRCKQPVAVESKRRQYLDQEGNVVHTVDMAQNMSSVCPPSSITWSHEADNSSGI